MTNYTLQPTEFTMDELCRSCAVHTEYVVELVQEGIIVPSVMAGSSSAPETWRFNSVHVRHTKVAWRLQHDLDINLPGAALALQLLDELESLRARVAAVGTVGVVDAD
jgi:chaperone modulatory protein CbpM